MMYEEDMRYMRLCLVIVIMDIWQIEGLSWLRYKLLDIYNKL